MVKLIFVYIITFFLAPIIGGIAGIIFLPLLPLIFKIKIPIILFRGIVSFIIGFVSVWFAIIIFSWFNILPTLLIIIILGLGYGFNDFRRIIPAVGIVKLNEIAGLVGNLLGIIVGGIYFL